LIWQYIHGQKLTDDDITLIMRALENHKNQIRVKVRGHEDMIALGETDTLTVRGKLNTDSARFWFKESEDAEKVSLYKKILTYTK
jgi:hypothetical protein